MLIPKARTSTSLGVVTRYATDCEINVFRLCLVDKKEDGNDHLNMTLLLLRSYLHDTSGRSFAL